MMPIIYAQTINIAILLLGKVYLLVFDYTT